MINLEQWAHDFSVIILAYEGTLAKVRGELLWRRN
jgi:hypothetical protein